MRESPPHFAAAIQSSRFFAALANACQNLLIGSISAPISPSLFKPGRFTGTTAPVVIARPSSRPRKSIAMQGRCISLLLGCHEDAPSAYWLLRGPDRATQSPKSNCL